MGRTRDKGDKEAEELQVQRRNYWSLVTGH